MKEEQLWDEKSYIDPQINLSKNVKKDNCDITTETKIKLTVKDWKDTTRTNGIYLILNKINNKWYVGSSCRIEKRWIRHRSDLNNNRHDNIKLQRAWNKYGKDNFEFHIVELVDESNLLIIEQKYLDWAKLHRDQCYNLSFIAGRCEMTDERRQHLSKLFRNRVFSDTHRYKLSVANTGKRPSAKTIKKMSDSQRIRFSTTDAWNKGKQLTHSHKQKLRMTKLGKKQSIESILKRTKKLYKPILEMDENGIVINQFFSLKELCTKCNLRKGSVIDVCKGKRAETHGRIFKYENQSFNEGGNKSSAI